MQWINHADYRGISQSCLNGFIIIHIDKYKMPFFKKIKIKSIQPI